MAHLSDMLDLCKHQMIAEEQKLVFSEAESVGRAAPVIITRKSGTLMAALLGAEVMADVLAGASLGFSWKEVQNLLGHFWEQVKNYIEGTRVDVEGLKKYSKKVKKHTNDRLNAMISDLKKAIERKEWRQVGMIQKQIKAYGEKVGYPYEVHAHLKEDGMGAGAVGGGGAPTNNVGGGHIAGATGEPPGKSKLKVPKRKKFAGVNVFEVNSDYFNRCRMGKRKYARYEQYVGDDEMGKAIREFGNQNYGAPIIIQDELTGAMCYLRYGNKTIG